MNRLKFILQLVDRVSGPASRATRGIRRLAHGMNRLLRTSGQSSHALGRFERVGLGKIAHSAFNMAGQMSLASNAMATLARQGKDLLTAPNQESVTFEREMSRVRALSQSTADQFKEQQKTARDLGATTVFTAQEAAQGMGFLAMAGFRAEQQIAALPAVMDLATAAGSDLGRTAEISSNIMGAFGIRAEDMRGAADVLAATFTNSNTTLESLGETMKYVGPNAKAAGVGLAEIAKFAAVMGNAGIDGSLAGTALRAALQRLSAPPKAAAKAIQKLGISTKDVAGNLRSPIAIFKELNQAMEGMGSGDRTGLISAIFGIRASAGVAEVLDKLAVGADAGVVSFEQLSTAINKAGEGMGRTREIAGTMTDNRWGRLKELQSAFADLSITVGNMFAPTLLELVETGKQWVAGVGKWIKANPQLTVGIMKGVAAMTLLAGAGAVVANVASALLFGFGAMVKAFGAVYSVLRLTAVGLFWVAKGSWAALAGVARMTGAVRVMTGAMAGLNASLAIVGKMIAVVGAAWAGWEIGKILDAKIPEWFGFKGESFGEQIGKSWDELINGPRQYASGRGIDGGRAFRSETAVPVGSATPRGMADPKTAAAAGDTKTLNYSVVNNVNVDGAKDGKDVAGAIDKSQRRNADMLHLQAAY